MIRSNSNFSRLPERYLFLDIAKRVNAFSKAHPDADIIRMGIGDVTRPLAPAVIKAMHEAVDDCAAQETFHGYGPERGYQWLREAIVKGDYEPLGVKLKADDIFVNDGAKSDTGNITDMFGSGNVVVVPDPVYPVYVDSNIMCGRELTYIDANADNNFLPMPDKNMHADVIYICSPNNPTGVVYSEETIKNIAAILEKKQKEFGAPIYLLSDEPYRELAFDGVEVPYLTKYYNNTIVGYSFSKSLSLPGDRIGYLVIPDEADDSENIISAAGVATRILGFVNAPSLAQLVVSKCLDAKVDVEIYNRNRELLYNALLEYGYECVKPQGAFYLFVKALEDDDKAFVAKAKEHRLLIVPGSTFGCAGYVRIAYCVDYDMIKRSLPEFKALAEEYKK